MILNALICKNKPIQKNKPKNIKNIKENEWRGCQKNSDNMEVIITPIRPL